MRFMTREKAVWEAGTRTAYRVLFGKIKIDEIEKSVEEIIREFGFEPTMGEIADGAVLALEIIARERGDK